MNTSTTQLYESTVTQLQYIFRNVRNMPVHFTQKKVTQLKQGLVDEIRRLKPGIFEKHLEAKSKQTHTTQTKCASCKD